MKSIRILLVDNHELVRHGVRGMLEQEEDMEIIGDCSSAAEALAQTKILSPNIVLMEAKLAGMDGIEVTRRLHQKRMPCNVIILTVFEYYPDEALETGAAGYLLEDIKSQELAQAIRRDRGELVTDERLASTSKAAEGKSEYLPLEDDGSSILVKEAELVIPSPVDIAQLLRFIYQVEEALEATILQQVGSWDRGTAITILMRRSTPLAAISDRLEKMPDVESVREKPAAKHNVFNFPKRIIAKSQTHPGKELLMKSYLCRVQTFDNTKNMCYSLCE